MPTRLKTQIACDTPLKYGLILKTAVATESSIICFPDSIPSVAYNGHMLTADDRSPTAMLTMKSFVLVLRVLLMRKTVVTKILPTNARMLTTEIAVVIKAETMREQVD